MDNMYDEIIRVIEQERLKNKELKDLTPKIKISSDKINEQVFGAASENDIQQLPADESEHSFKRNKSPNNVIDPIINNNNDNINYNIDIYEEKPEIKEKESNQENALDLYQIKFSNDEKNEPIHLPEAPQVKLFPEAETNINITAEKSDEKIPLDELNKLIANEKDEIISDIFGSNKNTYEDSSQKQYIDNDYDHPHKEFNDETRPLPILFINIFMRVTNFMFVVAAILIFALNLTSYLQLEQYEYKTPNIFGYTWTSVDSESMSPVINSGDIVIYQITNNYEIDDIVLILNDDESLTTHRIVEIEEDGKITTKGDANEDVDNNTIYSYQIIGEAITSINNGVAILSLVKDVKIIVGIIIIYVLINVIIYLTREKEIVGVYNDKKRKNKNHKKNTDVRK